MKIRYLKAYFGIQPGTIVDEHRPEVVAKLTTWNIIDEKKGLKDRIAEPVEDGTATTAEAERNRLAEQAAAKPKTEPKKTAMENKKPGAAA